MHRSTHKETTTLLVTADIEKADSSYHSDLMYQLPLRV